MVHVYKPKGVCSREMAVEVDENGIRAELCHQGRLPRQPAGYLPHRYWHEGRGCNRAVPPTRCGLKATSCPDQLSYALEEAMAAAK